MAYDIAEAFDAIEEELIASMITNLKRHRAEETKEGFQWSQWQVEQLAALEEYKRRNSKKFNRQFTQINKVVGSLINAARDDGNMHQEEEILRAIRDGADLRRNTDSQITGQFFRMNDQKMNALINATQNDFRQAERAMLRQADDQYRKVIFNSMVYANSGAATYEKAVDMATKDFLRAGINCIEYRNGSRHTVRDYADMAIKTATKRAYLTGEGEKRKEWGTALVIVNKRTDACPKCLPFSGKVMIDDVWSGGKPDGKHMLISTAMERGLYHPRCRDSHTTYFPGISTAEDKGWTKEELEALEKDEAKREKLIYAENQAEKYDRMARHSLDEENRQKYEARAQEWGEKSEELTERRMQRLAQRKAKVADPRKSIKFDDRVSGEQREIIEQLSSQYQTRLQRVDIGAKKSAGEVDMSGAGMKLSDKHTNTTIHEFAHTLANSSADKYGLTNDQEFWKEIKKIRREYMKDVEGDPSRWISAYEHSSGSLDEFMAEAFTHAKMREMGLEIPGKYGSDFTYSERVLETVDRYFAKSAESGRIVYSSRRASDNVLLKKDVLERAKLIRAEVDLRKVSNSSIINMSSKEEILDYFREVHGIRIVGFENKDLFELKTTLAGYDDMLLEFPEVAGFVKEISYNPHIRANGQIDLNSGLSEVGKTGLKDYGTGVHEMAHVVDHLRSKRINKSYASAVVDTARKRLKLRINSTRYRNMVVRMIGPVKEPAIYDNPIEIFAFAVETSKGGVVNELADEIYKIMREGLIG